MEEKKEVLNVYASVFEPWSWCQASSKMLKSWNGECCQLIRMFKRSDLLACDNVIDGCVGGQKIRDEDENQGGWIHFTDTGLTSGEAITLHLRLWPVWWCHYGCCEVTERLSASAPIVKLRLRPSSLAGRCQHSCKNNHSKKLCLKVQQKSWTVSQTQNESFEIYDITARSLVYFDM